jgi:hypothetical protein
MTNLLRQLTFLLIASIASGSGVAEGQAPAGNSQSSPDSPVIFSSVFKVTVNSSPLYRVSYTYDFPGRGEVYIRGVGTVSSKGSLNYFHSGETLEFLDSPGGNTIYVAKIEHPTILMGGPAPAIPEETQFPQESRRGHWRGQRPFAEKAFSVLEQYFHSGYRTFEKETSLFYLTTYTEAPESPDGTRTQVSVLISHPAKSAPQDVMFTMAFTARERRSHTDWRDAASDAAKKSAETFVDGLLNALQQ